MNWNPIVFGLALDIVGFLLIFFFGGFEVGRSGLTLENDKSHKTKPLKIIGAVMVIVGFGLQLWGASIDQGTASINITIPQN